MTFLLGRQAMFGQEPPTYLRSMTATFCPWEARVQARYFPASPLPSTTTSYSSATACPFLERSGRIRKEAGEEWPRVDGLEKRSGRGPHGGMPPLRQSSNGPRHQGPAGGSRSKGDSV